MKILGTYRIEYSNGVVQHKNLVSEESYLGIIVPIYEEIYKIESESKPGYKKRVSKLKSKLKEMFGEFWFTENSPIYKSIETGELRLPASQGGCSKIKVTKLTPNPFEYQINQ